MTLQFMDRFSLGTLFASTLVLLLLFIEIGYRLGMLPKKTKVKEQVSQVRAIMGAMIGLMAFIQAFTFASAQSHYEQRVQYVVDDARAISEAFMQADFLEEPARTQARQLLHEYVGNRVVFADIASKKRWPEMMALITRSEQIQLQLWSLVSQSERDTDTSSRRKEEFARLVQVLMNTQTLRVQAAIMNRIPPIIWLALYLMGTMGMLVVGYQAGLTTRRSPIASATLAVAFAAVMMLVVDLDRPVMSLFNIDDQIILSVQKRIDLLMAEESAP